jgi:hypothetical protein
MVQLSTHINDFFHIPSLVSIEFVSLLESRKKQFPRSDFSIKTRDEIFVVLRCFLNVLLNFHHM